MAGKNIMFVVQGEGRGHLTQAIALQNLLLAEGFGISGVLIGKSQYREIPEFIFKQLYPPVASFESPNFIKDSKTKGIRVLPSVIKNFLKLRTFKKSLNFIRLKIEEQRPDVIFNFFDPLIGLYYLLYNPPIPMICIGHQYTYLHPDFKFPDGRLIDRISTKMYIKLTCMRAKKKLALSLYCMEDYSKDKVIIVPPLLRAEIYNQKVTKGSYLLIYLLNSGYVNEIIQWHLQNPDIEIHCYTDQKDILDVYQYNQKLYFHQLNDDFVKMMAGSMGLMTTAGFESICEAMYMEKPIFMVPVPGHYEQYCNAVDTAKIGAGIYDSYFNIDKFIKHISVDKINHNEFRLWMESGKFKVINQLNEVFENINNCTL